MNRQKLNIKHFDKKDLVEIVDVIHITVRMCYPQIYLPEVVNFFLEYHSKENILEKSKNGDLYTFYIDEKLIGTGYLVEKEVGGLYILPGYQNKGYGAEAMRFLLNRAKQKGLKKVWLDATPSSKPLYLRLGFKLIEEKVMYVKGDVPLPYSYMEFVLSS